MYRYSEFDKAFLAERNAQFRAQVERRIEHRCPGKRPTPDQAKRTFDILQSPNAGEQRRQVPANQFDDGAVELVTVERVWPA